MKFSQKMKRFWLCAAVLLGARFSGAGDDYLVIDISAGSTENYPVAYYDTLPGSVTDDLYKTDKIVLKRIPAGSFLMGSPVDEAGRPALNPNEDLHPVTLTEDFYIGVYEITEYQWSKILLYANFTKKPAVDTTVTMNHIKTLSESFIAKLNRGADLGGMALDLPTEAQWEYACRAGTQSAYSFGSDAGQLGGYAWFDGNNGTPSLPKEVGTKNPNPWGLYDMHGNAAEFCRDAYNANLGTNAVIDPYYVSGTAERVERSGAYNRSAADNRSAFRNAVGNGGTYRTGFRISVTIPPPPPLYELTVVNGSGDGSYTNAHVQTIIAEAPPQWFVFDQWTGMVAAVANLYAPTTTVTIAGADVSVGASYTPALFAVTVSSGTASAYSATNAQVVTLWADTPTTETNVFWRWEGDVAGVADIHAMTTTLTIAGADVALAAVYRHTPYTLTVVNGSGGGGYHFAGEVVAIQAPAPGEHRWFLWEGPVAFADAESWSTTLIMPAADTVVTATYPARQYDLTVVNGSGSGSYTNGAQVAVNTLAPPSALHQFERWAGDSAHLENPLLPSTLFTVSGADAVIYPLYQPVQAVRGEYMELNLLYSGSRFDVSYRDEPPAGGWGNTYKSARMAFRRIMPGTYQMGTGDVPGENEHTVTLTESFYIAVFEVTQGQWNTVVGGYPSGYSGSGRDYHPVENISYDAIRGAAGGRNWPASADVDAASFVGVMRAKSGSDGFDLPTEAQWEYACRAGTSGGWNVPDNQVLNVAVVSIHNQPARTHSEPVGTLAPNGWGLYDTHGNVLEWCLDWFLGTGLGTAPQTDPPGAPAPNSNFTRTIRGGSYDLLASPYAKAGYRAGQFMSGNSAHTGFRMIKREGLPRTLTVTDGKVNTGGVFYYRAQIGISAVDKPGETFDYWQVAPEGTFAGALFNAQSRDTVITMPNHSITVTARYR